MAEIPDRVSVNTRYQAVWNQTTAVVTERYRIFFQYTAVVLTLLGLAISRDEARKLALAVPYISLVAVLILTHLEIIIELLTENQRKIVETHGLQDDRPRTEEWNFEGAQWTIWWGVLFHALPIFFVVAGGAFAAFRVTSSVAVSPTLYWIRAGIPLVTGIAMVLVIGVRWWRVEMLGRAQDRIQRITDADDPIGE